jgi:hypothetical protein
VSGLGNGHRFSLEFLVGEAPLDCSRLNILAKVNAYNNSRHDQQGDDAKLEQ